MSVAFLVGWEDLLVAEAWKKEEVIPPAPATEVRLRAWQFRKVTHRSHAGASRA